jgi:hypothetical protein
LDLRDLDLKLGKTVVKVSNLIGCARVPPIHRRFPSQRHRSRRTPLHPGVNLLEHRFDVSAVEPVHKALESLDVLVRNTPSPCPQISHFMSRV